jgi:hypothetical protein
MSTSTVPSTVARTRTAAATAISTGGARQPARPGAVRLTRRGRVVVTLLLLGLLFAAFVVFSGRSVASGEAGTPVPTREVVVGEGDTLWGIAADAAGPDTDIRELVHDIEELNSLPGPSLVVGQEIAVPIG